MAGDDWQRFASLRLLLSLMYAEPGKKLLFMGAEIGAWHEWSHERSLDWHLCDHAPHRGIQRLVEDLNRLYRREPALHALDADPRGFTWLEAGDHDQSVLAFARTAAADEPQVVAVCNFTPVPREGYRIGVDRAGDWIELFNSDATLYGGSGMGNLGQAPTEPIASHGRAQSLSLVLPPLAAVLLRPAAGGGAA
jgi:1,4-alpha-glucan branching enzyme